MTPLVAAEPLPVALDIATPPVDSDHQRGALRRELIPAEEDRPAGAVGFDRVELWQLPQAARFSSDASLSNPVALISEFRRQPASQLLTELIEGSQGEYFECSGGRAGRPRMRGDWAALYLGYVADGGVAIQRFCNKLPGTGLLEACGFETAPSRQAIDLRFAELEQHTAAFVDVAGEFIGRARAVDPRVGVCVFVDGTGFQSASVLERVLDSGQPESSRSRTRVGRMRRASAEQVSEQHFRETEEPVALLERAESALGRTRGPIIALPTVRGTIRYRCFHVRGQRFVSRDLSSGLRWYHTSGAFWLGGYLQAAVDMYIGLPVALSVFPADVPEWDGYPVLFKGMTSALGRAPHRFRRSRLCLQSVPRVQQPPRCRCRGSVQKAEAG